MVETYQKACMSQFLGSVISSGGPRKQKLSSLVQSVKLRDLNRVTWPSLRVVKCALNHI